jgi:membrane protease YdiL (CAAX protease family)
VLVTANLLRFLGPAGTGLVLGPIVAIGLVVLARRSGLSWDELGLARRTWLRGMVYAVAAVGVVLAVYAVGIVIPLTRSAFLDARYHVPVGPALVTALIVIPLGTVLLEEVAFRGVLQALVTRHRGVRWGLGFSSIVFGVWHVLPSLGLNRSNQALGHLLGLGVAAQVAAVACVVVFTALAGLLLSELRRRSGSLLAAAGLHWATNGMGVLAAALIYAAAG